MGAIFIKIRSMFVSNPKLIIVVIFYLFLINVAAFVFCAVDNYYRNKTPKKYRKSFNDKYFILMAALGGGLGIMIGQYTFHRRKTSKITKSIIPAIVMLYLLFAVLIAFSINF